MRRRAAPGLPGLPRPRRSIRRGTGGAALLALAGMLAVAPADAQQVALRGTSDAALDRRLFRLLEESPRVVDVNTTVPRGDTVRGSVLVLDATLILEGVVLGDVVMVDAGAFVRPSAVVEGDVVNVAGGLYLSEIASIDGAIIDLPAAPYRVIREPGRLIIEATGSPERLVLDGVVGVQPPTYDRVNGVTAVWGATYRLPYIGGVEPYLRAEGGWRTEPGEPVYAGELGLRWLAHTLAVGYERVSDTNERWIRDDLMNSLNYLWSGKDYRDYHDVERGWVGLAREFGDENRRFNAVLAGRLQVEEASTLRGDDPWHLWGDSVRPNPPIDDGRITSAVAELQLEWRGRQTAIDGGVAFERALDWLDGQAAFNLVRAAGDLAVQAFANHTIEVELYAQTPVTGDTLPRQRWSFVGGSGTIQTVDFAQYYGDRVVFVETKYIVPLPERLALPLLGAPSIQLVHGAGMAWLADDARAFRQEVGGRLQFFAFYLRYMFEPEDPDNADLDIGLSWPFGGEYPWQR